MSFTAKDWKDYPNTTTPLNAAAVEDLETRLSGYTDSEISTHTADTTSVHGITDTSALVTSSNVDDIVVCTQATYNGLTPNSRTLYVISG